MFLLQLRKFKKEASPLSKHVYIREIMQILVIGLNGTVIITENHGLQSDDLT
jgi:hypothetical protein